MEIRKVYREHMPHVKLIGKRYTNSDRDEGGTFARYWQQWFEKGWFDCLEHCKAAPDVSGDYLGVMRMSDGDNFEYWIGMFLPANTAAPDGYDFIDLAEGDIGVCWIKGKQEDGSIFNMHDACLKKLEENGMGDYRKDETGRCLFFERYTSPRFTEKDDSGNVILDYGVYLA